MGSKTAISAGLLAGIAVGAVALGGILLLAPVPDPVATAPTAMPPSPPPSALPSSGAVPDGAPGASPSRPAGGASDRSGAPPSASTSPAPSPSASTSPAPSPSASAATISLFGTGEPAPRPDLAQLGCGRVDLAGLAGKPVWISFMASWCPPCRDELPLMNGFATRLAGTGLVAVAVDVREDDATVDAFMKSLGITFPAALDRDGPARQEWGAPVLPIHHWVDATGVVRYGALGGIGPDAMAEGLRTILPGVDVTP
jgi:thiol-disulfide isomerase/thioredoxin